MDTLHGDQRFRDRYWVSATSGSSGRRSVIPSNATEWAIDGNYPSKGTGERAAWFRDCEGTMLGMGQPTR